MWPLPVIDSLALILMVTARHQAVMYDLDWPCQSEANKNN